MTEIEQLRQDIATLEAAEGVFRRKYGQDYKHYNTELARTRKRLAKLEAEAAAKADPWEETKQELRRHIENRVAAGLPVDRAANYTIYLEQRVAELEKQLASERQQVHNVDSVVYVLLNDLEKAQARIAELKAELAKRPVADPEPTQWGGKAGGKWVVDGNGKPLVFQSREAARYIFADGVEIEPYTGEQS